METVQDLFKFILEQERCIVFGNLGRYPTFLLETLAKLPLQQVIVISNCCHSSHRHIRVQRATDPIDACDLVVYLEPTSLQLIQKHPLASRVVVFTSHFTFHTSKDERWIHIAYMHGKDGGPAGTQELLAKQESSLTVQNVGMVEGQHVNVLTLSGRIATAPRQTETYVIIDLTSFKKDTLTMYLAFWDAFDYMLEHKNWIDRWVICFSESGRQAFRRFTQKVIDAIFCRHFEHGNVKENQDLFALLPFYTSGTIDRKFDIPLASFGGIKIALVNSIEEGCKAAAMHDVKPLVKNVLWIVD